MRSPLKVLTTILAGLALASPALADDIGTSKKFGAGVGVGTLSNGVSGKLYFKDGLAAQATVGAIDFGVTAIGVDVVREATINTSAVGRTFWGVGAGAGTLLISGYGAAPALAVSGIVEVGVHMQDVPLEIVFDLRPTFLTGNNVYSGINFGNVGAAVRYYF